MTVEPVGMGISSGVPTAEIFSPSMRIVAGEMSFRGVRIRPARMANMLFMFSVNLLLVFMGHKRMSAGRCPARKHPELDFGIVGCEYVLRT